MPIAYSIDRQHGLIATAVTGTWNSLDFKNYLDTLFADPDFGSGLRGLVDLRQLKNAGPLEELQMLAHLARGRPCGPVPSRCALIVADDQTFEMMRMFEVHAAGGPFEYGTFRAEEEAFEWLGLPCSNGVARLKTF